MKSAKKDWPTSSSRLLCEYLGFVLFLLVLGTLIPGLTRTATVALCLLIPLLSVTSPTPPSLFQTRWKATLQSLGDGCIASATLLAVLLGAAYLRGEWRPEALYTAGTQLRLALLSVEFFYEVPTIALPEEILFRGYFQEGFDRIWRRRVRIFGAPCGWGLLLTSLLFACAHVLLRGEPQAILVVFPGLAFGWLYARRQSIAGAVVFHAASNLILLAFSGWIFRMDTP